MLKESTWKQEEAKKKIQLFIFAVVVVVVFVRHPLEALHPAVSNHPHQRVWMKQMEKILLIPQNQSILPPEEIIDAGDFCEANELKKQYKVIPTPTWTWS